MNSRKQSMAQRRHDPLTPRLAATLALAMPLGLLPVAPSRAIDLAVDDVEWVDPDLPAPPVYRGFTPRTVPLWRKALDRPDAETRRLACDTIALAAKRGMTGLDPFVEPLLRALETDRDPLVRRAAAGALVALDARQTAAALAAAVERDGLPVAAVAEPALGRWGAGDLEQRWLARLAAPETPAALVSGAIEGLGRIGAAAAAAPLEQILDDANAPPERRLAAARSLGSIVTSGLVPLAARYAAESPRPESPRADPRTAPDRLGRLVAVRLLARHADPEALALMTRLAEDRETAAALEALEWLDSRDRTTALEIARRSLSAPDAALRLLAARLAVRPTDADAIRRVKPLLCDRNPAVRRFVTGALADFAARPELTAPVIAAAEEVLGGDDWRGLEQASLLLGHLDHEPAAERLMVLLENPRGEVAIAAAWALKKLAIPESLPRILGYADGLPARTDSTKQSTAVSGPQAVQLFELFGLTRYAPADDLLRKFVPKSQLDGRARAAAIWALGHIHADACDETLAGQLAERLADVTSIPAEMPNVRAMSAVSLGRMGAKSQLETLETFASSDGIGVPSGRAAAWAVARLTGTPYPEIPTFATGVRGWFLEPP